MRSALAYVLPRREGAFAFGGSMRFGAADRTINKPVTAVDTLQPPFTVAQHLPVDEVD